MINIKFHEKSQLTPQLLVGIKAVLDRQVKIIGTNSPIIAVKTRGNEGIKLLMRLQKILDEIKAMQEKGGIV